MHRHKMFGHRMFIYVTIFSLCLFTGCAWFGLGRNTATPADDPAAVDRFLTSAPIPMRMTATQISDEPIVAPLPSGLPLPLVDPLNIAGDITISGSAALAPLTRQIYESFVRDGYRDTMRIEEVGTTTGFERYCSNTPDANAAIDIIMADRPITQAELGSCLEHSRRPVALRVARDAVVVVTHAEIDFLQGLTKDELAAIFTARRWSDVRRAWPATNIVRILPLMTETTSTLFAEKILRFNTVALQTAPATTFFEDSAEIGFEIADTPNALGLLKFADYQRSSNVGLRSVAVNGTLPTGISITSGNYLLTYPLLLYTDPETLQEKARVGAFLMYYLTYMNELMTNTGTFPVSEAVYERTKVVLLAAMGQESYLDQFAPTATPAPPTSIPVATITPTQSLIIESTPEMTTTVDAQN